LVRLTHVRVSPKRKGNLMRSVLPVGMFLVLSAPSVVAAPPAQGGMNLITQQSADGEILGWNSFHATEGTKTGDVWQLSSDGVLVCKGLPKGYLYTTKDYTDVVMSLEWRWPPEGKPGNGGLLLRMTGEHKIWPKSLEVQLNHGAAGDYWGLVGYSLAGPEERMKTLHHEVFGRLTNVKHTRAVEKPAGQWNRCEVVLKGGEVSVTINGVLVNEARRCDVEPGKILLTAEGSEIHFRHIKILDAD
ncbi:MAG: DUF1080 domain-containing protein, partial [Pirellulaceae bacterium]